MDGFLLFVLAAMATIAAMLLVLRRRPAGDDDEPVAARVARSPGAAPSSRRPASGPAPTLTPPRSGGIRRSIARRFHGVSIRRGPDCCQAVEALGKRRFLGDEAPRLPLPGCDHPRCECAYSHHKDRRDGDDRRSGWGGFGGFAPSVEGGNRRTKRPDRRITT